MQRPTAPPNLQVSVGIGRREALWALSSVAVLVMIVLLHLACSQYTVREGAANAFDSYAYDTLLVAQASIEQAKVAASTNDEKRAVNQVIVGYNRVYRAYATWHDLAMLHQAPDAATLEEQIKKLTRDVAKLLLDLKIVKPLHEQEQ